ncbi:MAG: glycosyltransferase family 4 protein [Chloroflexi bacterium]|nr:glycosyltransferase family 4 protein [Chloroflexota bacterium]
MKVGSNLQPSTSNLQPAPTSETDMHVALDLRLIGYAWGGTAQYGLQLATALADRYPAARLTVLRSRRAPSPLLDRPNVHEALALTPPHHRWEQTLLPLELLRVEADLLHSVDAIPPFRRRCPAVITVGDLGFLRYPETVTAASAAYYGQVGRAVHSAEHILTYSESSAEDLRSRLEVPSEKITVAPLAADPSYRRVEQPETALVRLGVARPYLLFVGTIEPRKNLPTLVKAFATIAREFPEVSLVVAGRRGWLERPVFDLVEELGLRQRVRFLGNVPGQELPSLYSGAEVFAFPSLHEGFGLPVLEAMACGCPVLCSNTSSLPEVADDAAWLLSPTDVAAWAKALRYALRDPGVRAELAARGLQRAARFTWRFTAEQTYEVYRRVVGT